MSRLGLPHSIGLLMFKLLGCLVAAYVTRALIQKQVGSAVNTWEALRSGHWWRTWSRNDAPLHYWTLIAMYCALAAALLTIF